jgi:predicted RNA-binding protein Jag
VTENGEGALATGASVDRPAQAATVLGDLLRLADVPATLDVKEGADGGISIALVLTEDVPGVTGGRRGTFLEALQFLVNKLTHRPGVERRWVSLGLGEHPAPRVARPPRSVPDPNTVARAAPAARPGPAPRQPVEAVPVAQRVVASEEPAVEVPAEVPEDSELTRSARAMAEASARTGRFYAVVALSSEDRARIQRAVADVPGVRAVSEGEGRMRRLVFTPDRPVPMPRRAHPLDDEDGDVAGDHGTGS